MIGARADEVQRPGGLVDLTLALALARDAWRVRARRVRCVTDAILFFCFLVARSERPFC